MYGSKMPDWGLYNATIEVKELKRLDPDQEDPKAKYLNSDIIMAYFEILWDAFQRTEKFEHRQMYMNNYLYTKLNNDEMSMKLWERWAKRAEANFKNWFNLDLGVGLSKVTKIYFPCNVLSNMHWGLAVVDLQEQVVFYYDSLLDERAQEINTIEENLKKLIPLVRPDDDASSWGFNQVQVPRQTNGFDCGLYVCKFARCLAFGETIADHHVSQIRYRVMKEILEKTVEGSPPPISS
jgi:sentrin-specific protease 1